jgi:hypothetical protein
MCEKIIKSRSFKAGVKIAEAIIEMVHLMYQNKIAERFYIGLMGKLKEECDRRKILWLKK